MFFLNNLFETSSTQLPIRIIIDKRTIKDSSNSFRKIAVIKYFRNNKELNLKIFDESIIEVAHELNREYKFFKYPITLDAKVSLDQLRLSLFDITSESLPVSKRQEILKDVLSKLKLKNISFLANKS